MVKNKAMLIRFISDKEYQKFNDLINLKKGNKSREAYLKDIVWNALNNEAKERYYLKEQIELLTEAVKDQTRASLIGELESRALLHLFIKKHGLSKREGELVNPIEELDLLKAGIPKAILKLLDEDL